MNWETYYFLFLSSYIPLPLSALKFIEKNKEDPFRKINELKIKEIEKHLEFLNKQQGIIIRNVKEKAQRIQNLIKEDIFDKIQEEIKEWKKRKIKFMGFFDEDYPKRLKEIKDAPKVIFYKGNFNFSIEKSISIVGTRNPTEYGLSLAYKISQRFAELGFKIVNGFAKGIDTAAIKGAISVGEKVIGVLGSGLLHPYPKENVELFNEIIEEDKGIFISEQLPDNSITKASLATRNRISSALSLGNLFIEGGRKSGAKWQLEYGKQQGKPIITLKPKASYEQAYLPNYIIENEEEYFVIKEIEEVESIANSIINLERNNLKKKKKEPKNIQKSLNEF